MMVSTLALVWALGSGEVGLRGRGVSVDLDPVSGDYSVHATDLKWTWSGSLASPVTDLRQTSGRDGVGQFHELEFAWGDRIRGSIRCYVESPAIRFRVHYGARRPGHGVVFPQFTNFPSGLHPFSYQDRTFAPPTFSLAETSTPWLLFDDQAHAAIFSPASNFLIAKMVGDGKSSIGEGLNLRLSEVPNGLDQDSLLVFSDRITRTWYEWGQALKGLYHRKMPSPEADVLLKSFGYWTDNGADYYYNYDLSKGYAPTLVDLVSTYRSEGILLGYLQLDSWWYEKSIDDPSGKPGGTKKNKRLPIGAWNRYGGLMDYTADPYLFPSGLHSFQRQIGLPLATHNRWIDRNSPYRDKYKISGIAAIDPKWWEDITGYLSSNDVTCYEQDWLEPIYANSPDMASQVGVADAFTDGMANATRRRGMTMQYCMATPRFFLQGVKYSNLTTIRPSGDRFEPTRWVDFLFGSQLAEGIGAWPWSDVFRSGELGNMILSVLSGGPVGTGDALGREDKANILQACRPDGIIVKPDRPIVPCDQTYLDDANRKKEAFQAYTYTEQSGVRTGYLFAFPQAAGNRQFAFSPVDLGFKGECYAYNLRTGEGGVVSASNSILTHIGVEGFFYGEVAPVTKSGIALLGDLGKIVPTGRQRLEIVRDVPNQLVVKVHFAKGESEVTLTAWSKVIMSAKVQNGSARVESKAGSGLTDLRLFRSNPGQDLYLRLETERPK